MHWCTGEGVVVMCTHNTSCSPPLPEGSTFLCALHPVVHEAHGRPGMKTTWAAGGVTCCAAVAPWLAPWPGATVSPQVAESKLP